MGSQRTTDEKPNNNNRSVGTILKPLIEEDPAMEQLITSPLQNLSP